jgi:hypothetical protein
MRKLWIIVTLGMALSLAVTAQTAPWRFSVMPGYPFSSSSSGQPQDFEVARELTMKSGWTAGLDSTYLFHSNFGLHVGLSYVQGQFKVRTLVSHFPPPFWTGWEFDQSFGIGEVGAEGVAHLSARGELYGQINVGSTFGLNNDAGSDGLAYGVALGYRHFFGEHAGIAAQVTYHRLDECKLDLTDVRVGVTLKF